MANNQSHPLGLNIPSRSWPHYISRYVQVVNGQYYNTMTRKTLPFDALDQELTEGCFLHGQEREALEQRLFQPPKIMELRVVATWECNLRCRHCSVLYQLVDRDKGKIDPDLINNFVKRYLKRYPQVKTIYLTFIGGEILLKAKECSEIIDKVKQVVPSGFEVYSTTTTNLSLTLDRDCVEFLDKLDSVLISLDGNEEQHNWQRTPYKNKDLNPYQKSYANIKRLIKLGMLDKLKVQAAMQQKVLTMESKIEYFTNLLKLGFKREQIQYGSVHPTEQTPDPDQQYLDCLQKVKFHTRPCCDYRYMTTFLVNSKNELFGSYYDTSINSKMADLNCFEMDELEAKYRQKILDRMAIFNDEVCMKKCPVVAYCWGGCVNGDLFNKGNPSKYCAREALTKAVMEKAKDGTLK